jgi:8-oxo-dGTP pyrophosphatase MutT (NUDIX family)
MPGIFVFPGGRVASEDRRPSGFPEPLPDPFPGLDKTSRQDLAVFARAALRETYEETGLLLCAAGTAGDTGASLAAANSTEPWQAFASMGLTPGFGAMRLVARAITPTSSPVRFHSRFFLADGETVAGEIGGDGELEDIHWAPLESLPGLPMADITLLVLDEALAHRAGTGGPRRPAALFRWVGPKRYP